MRTSTRPAGVRRLPLPVTEPPYDDETAELRPPLARTRRATDGVPVQGTLALSARTRAANKRARRPAGAIPPPIAAAAGPPEPRRWCAMIVQALIETLYGRRPVQQLSRWTNDAVYQGLEHRIAARPRAVSTATPTVRALRVCEVNPAVVEACAVLQIGSRVRALALRLEATGDQWQCTTLQFV
ncbi:Rv3235 family protein [Phytoactinopolyspora mesophila]|uniref:Uncharacterized protein n=1 Tax=Phytoactinopolyspora mesophila TaxID=2650750 RepID=A0A7K3M5I1_9ACTN|nr:Rv3235 family protein [Phytoactinopolyspora mesophila]NDL58581.1 hypothetical protein [Phytoactinopolyspora mesophila]